jgi:hypothetical protein
LDTAEAGVVVGVHPKPVGVTRTEGDDGASHGQVSVLFLHQDGCRCAVRFGTEDSALVGVSAVGSS